MGRPKGSKNGVRRVPIKIPKNSLKKVEPVFDKHILAMYKSTYYSACIESINHYIEDNFKTGENMNHYKVLQAAAYVQLGDQFKEAHSILDEVIAADPNYSSAYFNKGVAYFCEKKHALSLEMFEKALLLKPELEAERVDYFKTLISCRKRKLKVLIEKMEDQKDYNGNLIKKIKLEYDDDFYTNISLDDLKTPLIKIEKNVEPPFIPEALPKGFVPITAQDFFAKASELYSVGMLEAAHEKFKKAFELDPTFIEASIMAAKADELTDLVFLAGSNLKLKNYNIAAAFATDGLKIDPTNDFVNRMLYYYRGFAFYEMGEKSKCDQDFAEYQKLDKILNTGSTYLKKYKDF